MTSAIRLHVLVAVPSTGLSLSAPAQAQQATMSFFVTSVGKGNGADLGGLAGADAHCQALAKAAGSTETNWRAYLSTTEPGGVAGVNARDRIGKGPWQNAKGVVVAKNVEDLHSGCDRHSPMEEAEALRNQILGLRLHSKQFRLSHRFPSRTSPGALALFS